MAVPYTFGNATTSIPLSQLDTNFATAITIGNTAVYLGNTTTSFGNVTLTNVTISSGNATVTKVTTPTVDAGSGNALTLQSNSTTGLYIDTSQNVGIGTSSPGRKLDIEQSGTDYQLRIGDAGGSFYYDIGRNTTNGLLTFYGSQAAASGYVFSTVNGERMRIDTSGRVQIALTNSNARFSVLNPADGNPTIRLVDASGNPGSAQLQWTNFAINAQYGAINGLSAGGLSFQGSGAEAMRIDSSNNLLVGTTTAQATVTVYHAGNQKSADFYAVGNASGTPVMSLRKGVNDATTTNVYVQFLYNNGSTGAGQINGNGGSQAAFGSYSDARLKENIQSLSDQLEKVCSLRPVEFDYKDGNGHQIGFIAQEIQTIYPDVVNVGENEMLTVTGWNKTEARLVQAIKELAAKVDAQAAEIATLKGTK